MFQSAMRQLSYSLYIYPAYLRAPVISSNRKCEQLKHDSKMNQESQILYSESGLEICPMTKMHRPPSLSHVCIVCSRRSLLL